MRGFGWSATCVALTLLVLVAACDGVDILPADEARVLVEGPEGEVQLEVSLEFVVKVDDEGRQEFELLSADTIPGEMPFDERWDIRETRRFYVRALASDPDDEAVMMRVWIDDRELFRSSRVLSQEQLEYAFLPEPP